MSTLTESICLYDHVYFDPMRMHERLDPPRGASVLKESAFVRLLVSEGALELFPDRAIIEAALAEEGRDYDYVDFLRDYLWTSDSSGWTEPESEAERLQLYCEIVESAYTLLTHDRLLPEERGYAVFLGVEALMLMLDRKLGLSNEDLIFLEGLNNHSAPFSPCAAICGSISSHSI